MRSNPTQVGSGFYRKIAAGNNSTMAIDPYGTLSAWGENLYGQIGTNTVNNTLSWTQLSNGDTHSLALRSDGTLYAWGLNTSGQLGVGDTIARQSPTQISAKIDGVVTLTWSAVSAGASHSVAIASDGVAYGWGLNTSGQVGDITIANRSAPVQIGIAGTQLNYSVLFNGSNYLTVADNEVFEMTGDFTVEAWFYCTALPGSGAFGDIITKGAAGVYQPYYIFIRDSGALVFYSSSNGSSWDVASNVSFGTIAINTWYHVAVSRSGSSLRMFLNGVLINTITNSNALTNNNRAVAIGARSDGTEAFTGYISNVRIIKGVAQYTSAFTPSVSPFSNVANTSLLTCNAPTIIDGSSNAFVITNNGTATVSSSVNPFIYYSGGLFNQSSHFLNVSGQQTQLSFGTGDFTIECFAYGVTPDAGGTTIIDFTPSLSSGIYPEIRMAQFNWYYIVNGAAVIVAGFGPERNNWYHVALVRITGSTKLYINGSQVGSTYTDTNNYGVGLNRPTIGSNGYSVGAAMFSGYLSNLRIVKGVGIYTGNFTIPTNILRTVQAAGTNITALSGTETSLLTLQNSTFIDNSINNFTITNNNSVPISSTVVPFVAIPPAGAPGTLIASKISAGKDFTLAIKSDNTLWSWGLNTGYQLGNGITVSRSSPVQVGTSSWSQISAGASHALAIDSNNQLYGWGNNSSGQVGVNIFSWTQVAGNSGTGFAIRDDGSLWSWGINSWGQLGQNDTISNKSSPVAIGTDSWLQVSSGEQYVLAIRSDNTLWSWGINNVGQLGLDSIASRSSPVQVGTSSWSSVSAGINSSLGIKTDTTLWAWGSNGTGQLGIGLTTSRSSPVQVSSAVTTWSVISISASIAAAISTSGGLYLWGLALANGTSVNRSSPVQLGTESWSAVATGLSSVIGIDTLGRLYSWGTNTNHQLGDNSALTVSRSSPVQLGASSWSIVSAGTSSSFAITTDSRLFAWGLNGSNQLGTGDAEPRSSPVQIGAGINFTKISGGMNNSYAIGNNYYLYAWGNGSGGAIGDGTVVTKLIPTQVGGVNNNTIFIKPFKIGASSWSQISAGYSHSVALTSDNQLFTWGNNTNGQLGFNMSFISISAGYWTTSVIRSDGTLWAWGGNQYGQLGDNTTVHRSSPVQVGILINWSKTTRTSLNTSYAIDNTGKLYAWGENTTGQLGNSTTINRSSPIQIGSSNWTMVATTGLGSQGSLGDRATVYAIRSDGGLFVWGNNSSGQRGFGESFPTSSPVQIGNSSWSLVSGGEQFVMGITVDGKLYGWGLNNAGQLGVTPSTFTWSKISSSGTGTHTLAIRSDNKLFAWGLNSSGQLGTSDTINRSSPVQVASGSYTEINAGLSSSYAIKSDGSLWGWGNNAQGQLGLNNRINHSSPIQIGTSSWSQVSASKGHSSPLGVNYVLASTSDNKLFAWGTNSFGQLGLNDTVNRSSPVQIGSGSWSQVGVGNDWVLAIDTSNKLYAWGSNSFGKLGGGDQTPANHRSTPQQIGALSIWNNMSAGAYQGVATDNTGALYTWGLNTLGSLGLNDRVDRSSPTQVTSITIPNTSSPTQVGTSSYILVNAGNNISTAISSDSKLFVWGLGTTGQLGTGVTFSRSSPVQISTNSYNLVSAGGTHTTFVPNYSPQLILSTGLNTSGQLGLSDIISRSSPIQVAASISKFNSPVTVSAGDYSSYYVSSPTQVGTSSWTAVSAGGTHTLGVKYDNTLWAWGYNANGQLGSSNTINRSSPVQIGTSSWSQVSAGDLHNTIAKSDGTINTFGLNSFGQLGDGT